MTIETIKHAVADNLLAVEKNIYQQLQTDVELIHKVACHLMDNGGKRLRPLVLLLVAKSCDYSGQSDTIIALATAIEFIHSATLLHDDVVDASELRRGKTTAHKHWGNAASILVGDFLYSRAFQLMVAHGNTAILRIFSAATNKIAEGEVQQLMNRHNADLAESHYLSVLQSKTGKLFEVAAHVAAELASSNEAHKQQLRQFGMHLGTAFQLIDDSLDYAANSDHLGKNIGDDLAEGSPTLPLLYAMQHAKSSEADIIREAIRLGSSEQIATIQDIINRCGALAYTREVALQEAAKAKSCLQSLAASRSKTALLDLVEFAVNRQH